ncbi:glycosyltransferase family 4 protein [Guptibacillus hwajinpoensis]|uniref:Glycosyltransferase involved in cell wall biosynthesis n=1 Tax=Guptibacillus hwajinpoensis TaxID=208199 RepID=A0ABU0JZA2_9BACL|nr:glycosyltransferase family 4 protein [Alkalihalobacillus hemicentroti]MDQ0482434.1 glycosyltransferase involved in cell wall biosynthesis [Alkalihalobacillus hemicentroti]
MKKNILFIHAGAEMYGADKVLLELIKGLDKDEFSPIVLLPTNGLLIDKLNSEKINTKVLKFPVLRRKYFNFFGVFSYLFQLMIYTLVILIFMKKNRIDIVHTNTLAVLPAAIAAKILGVPNIWHVHEIITSPKILNKALSYFIYYFSNKIIVVSKAVGNHLCTTNKKISKKMSVIYNGIDTEMYNPKHKSISYKEKCGFSEDTRVIGMIGRINRWKGQSYLLESMKEVLEDNPNSHLLFVGGVFEDETIFREQLLVKIKDNNIENRVTVMDFQNDIHLIHGLFDVFILPSTEPDPLPTVVLEAMATGNPVVANAHGGSCEMVVDNKTGYLIPLGKKQLMAEKVTGLIKDKQLLSDMGIDARKRAVQSFSIKSYVNNFERVYSSS